MRTYLDASQRFQPNPEDHTDEFREALEAALNEPPPLRRETTNEGRPNWRPLSFFGEVSRRLELAPIQRLFRSCSARVLHLL
jgi:hypothetical protein